MSNYTKLTDYASKDALAHGNPNKIVKGVEIGPEFDAVSTAIATKLDASGGTASNLTISSMATDLAIADGGTGASTAANARTNLGVTATGSDTTYCYRANNLSDIANAATARSNLSAAASGANTDITSLNAPALGAATATTQSSSDNTTKVATTAMVQSAISASGVAGSWEKIAEALPSGASAVTWTNTTITADYDDLMIMYEIYGSYGGGGVALRTGGADGVIDTGGSDYFDNGGSTNECTLGGAYAGTSTGIVMLFNIQEARYTNILSQNIYIDGITSQITMLPYGRKEAAAVRAVSIYISGGTSFSGRVTLLGRKGI